MPDLVKTLALLEIEYNHLVRLLFETRLKLDEYEALSGSPSIGGKWSDEYWHEANGVVSLCDAVPRPWHNRCRVVWRSEPRGFDYEAWKTSQEPPLQDRED